MGGVDFPGEDFDFALGWGLGRAVERDWTGWWGHEESVGELFWGKSAGSWQEEFVAEHSLGAVWWCCGAGAVREHTACRGEGCGSVGGELEGVWLLVRRVHWLHVDVLVHGFRL